MNLRSQTQSIWRCICVALLLFPGPLICLEVWGQEAPAIQNSPSDQTVEPGQSATFAVQASGIPTPSGHWQRQPGGTTNWGDLIDNASYVGSFTPSLLVQGANSAMNGDHFRCVLTNSSGSVTSAPAALEVLALQVATLAGLAGIPGADNGAGAAARFTSPRGIAVDALGTSYVADTGNHTIRRITPGGSVTTFAGQAGNPGSADGLGTSAQFNQPSSVAVDGSGTVYVADTGNNTIRKISPAGEVTTLAGLAGSSGSVDGTNGSARFHFPKGVAVDAAGNLYVADQFNHTIRKLSPAGAVTTLAGQATSHGSADGTNNAARFYYPNGVAVDALGNVYVADTANHTLRTITPAGVVSTLAGQAGSPGSADGPTAAARFFYPDGVAVDAAGNVYVADTVNDTLRKITLGAVYTLAGLAGNSGNNNGAGQAARFDVPSGVAVDAVRNLYIADTANDTVRQGVFSASSMPTRVIGLLGNLAFGNVQVGQTATQTLTIANSGDSTLTVSGISYPPGFSGAWSGSLPPGQSTNVSVIFAPLSATNYGGLVTVSSDATGGLNTISASGTGMPLPTRIVGLAGNLAFGAVPVGQIATQTVTITNAGNSAMTVSNLSYPPGFSGAWSGSIAAYGSQAIIVSFTPTAAVAYAGNLDVRSDATGGVNTLPVSGLGVVPTLPLQLTGMSVSNGVSQFVLHGQAGSNFVVQTSSNLVDWLPLSTNAIPAGGFTLIIDPSTATEPRRFYRAVPQAAAALLFLPAISGTITPPFVITNNTILQPATTSLASGGRAVYDFTIAAAGSYLLQAVVDAPNDAANSFFLNIDAEPQDPYMIWDILPYTAGFEARAVSWRGNGTFDANQFAPMVFSLTQGAHQLIVRGREGIVALQSITLVPTNPPSPVSLVFSATAGVLTSPFATTNGYLYQAVQSGLADGGRAAYNFTITNAGNYVIQGLVNAANDGANSFFLNIDAEPQDPLMIWDIPLTAGFELRTASWRGNGSDTTNQFVPAVFNLTAGNHQLILRGREASTLLQTIGISTYP